MVTDPDEMQTQDTSKAYEQVKVEEEKPDSVNCSVGADKCEHTESFPVVGRQHWRTQLFLPGILTKFKKERSKGASIQGFG
jgi:hypothetical protein